MRCPLDRSISWKRMSWRRVAGYKRTGTLTSPKLIVPDQTALAIFSYLTRGLSTPGPLMLCGDGLIHLHRVAGGAPGGQTAFEQPGVIPLASQHPGQPGAGLFVGAGAIGNDGLVMGQVGEVVDEVGRVPVAVEDRPRRYPQRSRDLPPNRVLDERRGHVQDDRLAGFDGLPGCCRIDPVRNKRHVFASNACRDH